MKRQILFFDVDGTLIAEGGGKSMPDSTIYALKKAQEAGHLLIVNSGRTIRTLQDEIKAFPFDGFICGCGTRIVFRGQTLFAQTYSAETCQAIIASMKKHRVEAFLEGSQDVYFMRGESRIPTMNFIRKSFGQLGLGLSRDAEDPEAIFDKFCILTDGQEDLEAFMEEWSDVMDFIDRGRGNFECVPKGISKATAMKQLFDHLKIDQADSWAFGDSSNDIPMLEAAAHSVALGEHDAVLDDVCEIITDAVEEDGIYHAMLRGGLITE